MSEFNPDRTIRVLQDLHRGIAGIRNAPAAIQDYPEGDIDTDLCPIVLVWLDSGRFWRYEPEPKNHNGIYTVEIYYTPVGQGTFAVNKAEVLGLLKRFVNAYLSVDAQLCAGPMSITLDVSERGGLSHSGITNTLQYFQGGNEFHGFTLRVPIQEQWDDDGEDDCEGC